MKGFFQWFKSNTKIKRWIFLILTGIIFLCYAISNIIIIQELDWTNEKQRELIKDKDNIDYIIGSDLVWNPKLREPLANTIKYYMEFT